ncbi:MAG: bifunctional phosphopantothenoylcysteine decarboxylase/phosphopantothenate--cysteine ligase CoaBC [Acetobacteraceae bacterium]|nr:bifunctional phosphopantothenoylcysteine decarboxylase/phosphopantothenate--cysteine ligase CoaBC [Acetobacteraceae bacterium]
MRVNLAGRRILLVVSGSIAAYKALELARLLGKDGADVTGLLTAGGEKFVTQHALAAITGRPVARDLWGEADSHSLHIELARAHDLVLVAPASADLMAKAAHGLADDLASTVLLATTLPVLWAPAMNPTMWAHPATMANLASLRSRGAIFVGPAEGAMAEAESGAGRLVEPAEIVAAVTAHFAAGPLHGRHALVTSGPTIEPIDPVRFISNRSSGRQGFAIAAALAALGARVTCVSGPVFLAEPPGVEVVRIETARQMLAACEAALPADIGLFAAAVADWRPAEAAARKQKKADMQAALALAENPDILASIGRHRDRPRLVIGFAAETHDVVRHAEEKRVRKGADWIIANDVSGDVMGGAENLVHIVTEGGVETWPRLAKDEVARRLARRIAVHIA